MESQPLLQQLIAAYMIDDEGYAIEPVVVNIADPQFEQPGNMVVEQSETSFFRMRWDGEKWVEGATQEEINAILAPAAQPTEIELLRTENELIRQQLNETNDALIELAAIIMGGE